MLTGFGVEFGLIADGAASALEQQIGAFTAGKFGLGAEVTCHVKFLPLIDLLHAENAGATVDGFGGGSCETGAGDYIRCGGVLRTAAVVGNGSTSAMETMRIPNAPRARTEDSRPGPGPLISTSRF